MKIRYDEEADAIYIKLRKVNIMKAMKLVRGSSWIMIEILIRRARDEVIERIKRLFNYRKFLQTPSINLSISTILS